MTDETTLTPQQEDDALAAELALGLLEGEEAKAAVTRLSEDPAFAQNVRDWQERLSGMAEGMTPVMAPARAWQGIREKLGHVAAPLTEDPTRSHPWWRGPAGIFAGLCAVAAIALFLWLPGSVQDTSGPAYRAELISEDEALRIAARLESREIEVTLEQGSAAEGRDFEIWWIEPDGSAPVSLGVIPESGSARVSLPEGATPGESVKIAVSNEPTGGSPTGQATGAVLAIASLTAL